MPTDITPATCRGERCLSGFRRTSATEVKSGFLVLLGPGGMQRDVRVVVYRTTLEHFAVIYPRKRVAKPIGVVNLRNTIVEQETTNSGFVIRQRGYDNTISAKFMCLERDIASWLTAFASRASPHGAALATGTPCLPVLEETEES